MVETPPSSTEILASGTPARGVAVGSSAAGVFGSSVLRAGSSFEVTRP